MVPLGLLVAAHHSLLFDVEALNLGLQTTVFLLAGEYLHDCLDERLLQLLGNRIKHTGQVSPVVNLA